MIENKDCWLKDSCKQLHCKDESGCLILYKLDYLYNESLVPIKLRKNVALRLDDDGTDLEAFKKLKNIQDNVVDFVKDGEQLYIFSKQAGNGKTSWALRLLQTYFKKIWLKSNLECKALFINVPSFLLALKANINNPNDYYKHIEQNVLDCDLVIWDDIGAKVGTEFEVSHLLSIIDSRLNQGKANIYTSNISPNDLGKFLDVRLASRVCSAATCIEFLGGDKRGI